MSNKINIVLKQVGTGPYYEFVEIEDESGKSISIGKWSERADGFTQISVALEQSALQLEALKAENEKLKAEAKEQKELVEWYQNRVSG